MRQTLLTPLTHGDLEDAGGVQPHLCTGRLARVEAGVVDVEGRDAEAGAERRRAVLGRRVDAHRDAAPHRLHRRLVLVPGHLDGGRLSVRLAAQLHRLPRRLRHVAECPRPSQPPCTAHKSFVI